MSTSFVDSVMKQVERVYRLNFYINADRDLSREIAKKIQKKSVGRYNGFNGTYSPEMRMYCTDNCRREGNTFIVVPEGVVYGPYMTFPRGTYFAVYHFNGSGKCEVELEVSAPELGRIANAKAEEFGETTLRFELDRETHDVEIKLYNKGTSELIFNKVCVMDHDPKQNVDFAMLSDGQSDLHNQSDTAGVGDVGQFYAASEALRQYDDELSAVSEGVANMSRYIATVLGNAERQVNCELPSNTGMRSAKRVIRKSIRCYTVFQEEYNNSILSMMRQIQQKTNLLAQGQEALRRMIECVAGTADRNDDTLKSAQSRFEAEQRKLQVEHSDLKDGQGRLEKEQNRLECEQGRLESEQQRLGSEQGRLKSEQQRLGSEQGRLESEQGRLESELQRLGSEQGRLGSEQQRLGSEQGRLESEQGRLESEQGRLESELQRLGNEQGRLEGEQQRLEGGMESIGQLRDLYDKVQQELTETRDMVSRQDINAQNIGHEIDNLWKKASENDSNFRDVWDRQSQIGTEIGNIWEKNKNTDRNFQGEWEQDKRVNDELGQLWKNYQMLRQEMFYEIDYRIRRAAAAGAGMAATTDHNTVSREVLDAVVKPSAQAVIDSNGGKIRLNLGCGHIPVEGYVNVDARDLPGVDIVADIQRLPYDKESVDEIFSAHLLEHFEITVMEREIMPYWTGLLKKGGTMRIIFPDSECMIEDYNNGDISFNELTHLIMGGQEYDKDYHYTMYNLNRVTELLEKVGLKDIKVVARGRKNGGCRETEIIATK